MTPLPPVEPWREAVWRAVPEDARPERFARPPRVPAGERLTGASACSISARATGPSPRSCAAAGCDVVAVDVAEEALRRARARVPGLDARRVHEGGPLPLDEDAVDVVWAGEVLEHVADVVGLLAEVRRVLRWGGRLLVTTPVPRARSRSPRSRSAGTRSTRTSTPAPTTCASSPRRSLRSLLADAGFAEVDVRAAGGAAAPAALRSTRRPLTYGLRFSRRFFSASARAFAASARRWVSARLASNRSAARSGSAGRGTAPVRSRAARPAGCPGRARTAPAAATVSGSTGCMCTASRVQAAGACDVAGRLLDRRPDVERRRRERVGRAGALHVGTRLRQAVGLDGLERVVRGVDRALGLPRRPDRGDGDDDEAERAGDPPWLRPQHSAPTCAGPVACRAGRAASRARRPSPRRASRARRCRGRSTSSRRTSAPRRRRRSRPA